MRRFEMNIALTARWRCWTPVRKIFAALAAFLMLLITIATGLLLQEIFTTDLIASQAIKTRAIGENLDKNGAIKIDNSQVQRGAYLAKVGNCAGCHTARGGAVLAGGKAINTPFGTVYTSNITPDTATGIGKWSADAFYRAMHEGRSADGHLLTPAFPYPNYTHITRADSDDLHAYFMHGVAPVVQANKSHELPFPFNTQLALAFWRTLFFDKNVASINKNAINSIATEAINTRDIPATYSDIERGAYLVRGLGHCSACHAERNALGASINDQLLGGALMPMRDWYAPSLVDPVEAGVAHLPRQDVIALLKTGIAPNASMLGPMAEVVAGSTQFWSDADLQATAAYLQSLPQISAQMSVKNSTISNTSVNAKPTFSKPVLFDKGAEIFTQNCATCHGEHGQGMRVEGNVALPALAGNRAVTLPNSTNLVRILLAGGYAPSTAGNPRPFGMPPFAHVLGDEDIAAVTTYIRNAWGNQAASVTAADVVRQRRGVMQ
jgi:mono/diheme cytochrome c family protein